MADEDDSLVEQLMTYVNGLGAELTVQKIILQAFVARMITAFPSFSEEVLNDLRRDVMTRLDGQSINPQTGDPEGQKRSKELSIEHGKRFFRELEAALSAARNKAGESGRN